MTVMSVVELMAFSSLYFAVIIQSLLPQNIFDLTDLFLNFAGYLLTGAFGF